MQQPKDWFIYFFFKPPFRSLVNYIKEKGVKEQCGGIPDHPIKWWTTLDSATGASVYGIQGT